ncbi:MAG: hypothetical protein LBU70_00295 [Chitinispirillales bacterium]|jgi:hypothetical protein|nr:hypothetical protein [Chitinispirillales bacterium]
MFGKLNVVVLFGVLLLLISQSVPAQIGVSPSSGGRGRYQHESSSNTLPAGGGDVSVVGEMFFNFTPNRTGMWAFRTSNNGDSDPYLWLYDGDGVLIAQDDDGGGGTNALIVAPLTAHTRYRIRAGFFSDGTGAYVLTNSLMPTEELSSSVSRVIVNGEMFFSFKPNRSGIWTFYTSNNGDSDPFLWLYDASGNIVMYDDDGGDGLNAHMEMPLTARTQFFVRAGFAGGGTGAYSLNIAHSELSMSAIPSSGGSVIVNGQSYFTFTPRSSGVWTFRTSKNGDSDPYLWLYTHNLQLITEDDDGADNRNALISIHLVGGTQYIVRAGFYSGGTGAYTLDVSR